MKLTALPMVLVLFVATCAASAQTPYAQWKHGPPADPGYFPIAVWLQDPSKAARYKEAGINLYMALWQGPTDQQLAELKAVGMAVICDQNAVGLKHLDDSTIVGWMQPDEPDNAQDVRDPKTGKRGYGPPVNPEKLVADYQKMHDADPTRPVYLGLGQGVTNEQWHGRGSSATPQDYFGYVRAGDIIGYDVYPMANPDLGRKALWLVPQGVDRLRRWTGGEKPIWNCIECTNINGHGKATPHEVKAEVWMSLIHGSKGIVYFVHQFKPRFDEHALLDDPEMLAAVTEINRQIHDLAPALNSPTVAGVASAKAADGEYPIDVMVKHHGGATYVFSVDMSNRSTQAIIGAAGAKDGAEVEVIGENRKITIRNGSFEDRFEPYEVHLYRIDGR